jgi:hypothetical protein
MTDVRVTTASRIRVLERHVQVAVTLLVAIANCTIYADAIRSTPTSSLSAPKKVALLLRDGRWIEPDVTFIDDQSVRFADLPSQPTRDVAATTFRTDIVACIPGGIPRSMDFLTQASGSSLVFADGQLVPGTLRCTADGCVLDHRWLESVPVELDRLAEIRFVASRRAPSRSDADVILLANGDLVPGFVISVGDEVVLEAMDEQISPNKSSTSDQAVQSQREATDLPAQRSDAVRPTRRFSTTRVAAISFASGLAGESTHPMVWTVDGSIVRAESVRLAADTGWIVTPSLQAIGGSRQAGGMPESVARPSAIVFDPSSFIPLSSCAPRLVTRKGASYRFEQPPQVRIESPDHALLGLSPIRITGAGHLRFALPEQDFNEVEEIIFTARLSLVEPAPEDARVSVEIRFGDESTGSLLLDASTRTHDVRVTAVGKSGVTLEVRVEDGGNGIAGDRVLLERACFIRQR